MQLLETFSSSEILNHNVASEIGHPCIKYLTLRRLKAIAIPEGIKRLFSVGSVFEQVVLERIQPFFLINETQVKYFNEKLQLSGVVDAIVNNCVVMEIKSMSSDMFKIIRNITNFEKEYHKNLRTQLYYYQLQAYFLLTQFEEGILFCINRESGEESFFKLDINPEVISEIENKCKTINYYVQKNDNSENLILPEGLNLYDICKSCYYYNLFCQDDVAKDNITMRTVKLSASLQEKLDRYFLLQSQLKELKKLEQEVKEVLKEFEQGLYFFDGKDYYVSVKEYKRKVLELPEEIRSKLSQFEVEKVYKYVDVRPRRYKKEEEEV